MKTFSLLSLLVAMGVAGCTTPPTTPVYQYQTILVYPDKALTPNCTISAPPDPTTYLKATQSDRESMLTNAWIQQTTNLTLCDQEITRLNNWFDQQIKLYPGAKIAVDSTQTQVSKAASSAAVGAANVVQSTQSQTAQQEATIKKTPLDKLKDLFSTK